MLTKLIQIVSFKDDSHAEISLSRLDKDDLIRLELDYEQINVVSLEILKSYNKIESYLAITKVVNESFRNKIITLKRQYGKP